MRLIKGLQERVARLEAQDTLDSGEMKPAAQEGSGSTSQARLLETSIVSAVPQRANVSEKAQPAPTQATISVKDAQAAQASLPSRTSADDKTMLPESSDGNPAIFGEFNPGRGFVVGRGEYGELDLSGYMAARYLNQLPGTSDGHGPLGPPDSVMPRNDFQFHRVMLFSQGWLFDPKFQYSTFVWTVQDTNQVAVGGALYYNFGKYDSRSEWAGTLILERCPCRDLTRIGNPLTASWRTNSSAPTSHKVCLARARSCPRLQYRWMVGNNNSNLDVPAVQA